MYETKRGMILLYYSWFLLKQLQGKSSMQKILEYIKNKIKSNRKKASLLYSNTILYLTYRNRIMRKTFEATNDREETSEVGYVPNFQTVNKRVNKWMV